jgi:DNA-binding GntR family transcriptional regulator
VRNDTYERLKHSIVNHEYPPGAIVGISELARDFGVSRTPIREALNILERDFLVPRRLHESRSCSQRSRSWRTVH